MQSSCAASVWPTAQMSSRSPSTVNSAVRRMARGSMRRPRHSSLPERQSVLLEYPLYGLQIEFGRQIDHREIFVIEFADRRRLFPFAIGDMAEQVHLRLDVPVKVHAHERGKLDETGIDAPPSAGIAPWDGIDQVALEPADGPARCQPIDLRRVDPGIDRASHQGHAARLRRIAVCAMTATAASAATQGWQTASDMRAGAQHFEEIDNVFDEVVEIKAGRAAADVARIVPISDIDVVLGEHRAHGAAQQCGKMSGHRRHQQHSRLRRRECPSQTAAACRTASNEPQPRALRPAGRRPRPGRCQRPGGGGLKPGARDQLIEGVESPMHHVAGNSGQRVRQPRCGNISQGAQWRDRVGVGLKILVHSSCAIRSSAKLHKLEDLITLCEKSLRTARAGVGG